MFATRDYVDGFVHVILRKQQTTQCATNHLFIIAFLALFISGTDYFVGGILALFSGPVAYFIFRRKYDGLSRKDPVNNPANPITRLGIGDTKRMALMFGCLTAAGIIATYFLPWYDDPLFYAEDYGIEGIFDILMMCVRWMTAAFGVITVALTMIALRVEPTESSFNPESP